MGFFKYLKNRSLRIDILSIFLLLIGLSSLSIIGYNYSRMTDSIMDFSKGVILRASAVSIERIYNLIDDAEDIAETAIHLLNDPEDFSIENRSLINYMFQVIEDHPNIYGLYYGRPDGSLLEVVNLDAAYQTHFIYDPSKPLPNDSAYALRYIDRSKTNAPDTWYYKDKNLKTIAEETQPNTTSNPTIRPWYIGAVQAKGELFWTPVYHYDPMGEPGITVSEALILPNGQASACVGVDISLERFSHFLTDQKIGKDGKAFVLDTSGHVIIPEEVHEAGITKKVIDAAYREMGPHHMDPFVFYSDDVPYLALAQTFPVTNAMNWIILIVAPLHDFMGPFIKTQREVALISVLILAITALLIIYFSKRISGPIVLLAKETEKIRNLDFSSETRVPSNIREIKLMDDSIAAMRLAIRSFGRYIPKEIVAQLIKTEREIEIGGEKKEISVLFSDIEGFTSIAETMPPEKLMPLLAEYFDLFSNILLRHQGNIDKFIGDGIMALWGAPKDNREQALHACTAALEAEAAIARLNESFAKTGKPMLRTRIGIDTGEAVVGNVGTKERMNYTAMGNIVNTASRLQTANKTYHTSILVSERVVAKIQGKFLFRPLDIVELKGKKEKTKIYELMDPALPGQAELAGLFTEAFDLYQKDPAAAKPLFLKIKASFPGDFPTSLYTQHGSKFGF